MTPTPSRSAALPLLLALLGLPPAHAAEPGEELRLNNRALGQLKGNELKELVQAPLPPAKTSAPGGEPSAEERTAWVDVTLGRQLASVRPLLSVEGFADLGPEVTALEEERTAWLRHPPPARSRERAAALMARSEALGAEVAKRRSPLVKELVRPSTLVISGGVSLGSYQAGLLYYYTQFLLAHRDFVRNRLGMTDIAAESLGGFAVATGASAGSINAFLASIAACQAPVKSPEESLFFSTWIPVGMKDLATKDDGEPNALYSRAPIRRAIEAIRTLWQQPDNAGWSREPCRAWLGMTVTRLKSRELNLQKDPEAVNPNGRVVIHRQTEKFLLELDRRAGATATAPAFRPFRPRPSTDPSANSPLNEMYPILGAGNLGDEIPLDDVMALLTASSSFPIAFQPVELQYRRLTRDGKLLAVERQHFLDGGVFDNTPLLLSIQMNDWLRNASREQHRSEPWYVFVEPDAIGWREAEPAPSPDDEKPASSLLSIYGPFISEFVSTAREAELQHAVEQKGEVWDTLKIPARRMPVASEHLLAFTGFYERRFRVFDFYLGMADAWSFLAGRSSQFQSMARAGVPVPITSPTFDCFRKFRELDDRGITVDPQQMPECTAVDRNLVILLAVSQEIRRISQDPILARGNRTRQFFEALDRRGFTLEDLTYRGSKVPPRRGMVAIREAIEEDIERLRQGQGGRVEGVLVPVVGKVVANYVDYRPPRYYLGGGSQSDNGIELQAGRALLRRWPRLRLGVGVRYLVWDRVRELGSTDHATTFDLQPFAHLVSEVLAWPTFQVEVGGGVAGEYKLKYADVSSPLLKRWGPEALLGLVFFQRVYVNVTGTFYQDDCGRNPTCPEIRADDAGRMYALSPSTNVFRWSLGWRFLW